MPTPIKHFHLPVNWSVVCRVDFKIFTIATYVYRTSYKPFYIFGDSIPSFESCLAFVVCQNAFYCVSSGKLSNIFKKLAVYMHMLMYRNKNVKVRTYNFCDYYTDLDQGIHLLQYWKQCK